jgi:rhodanese-related sulfurtransferase
MSAHHNNASSPLVLQKQLRTPVTAKWICLLCLLALPFAILNAWLNPHRPAFNRQAFEFPFISVVGLQVLQREGHVLLLDARSPGQFAEAHIPGALPLYPGNFDDDLVAVVDLWQPDQSIVVYCDDAQCQSSSVVARRIREELGLDPIYLLEGGWSLWIKETEGNDNVH